VKPTQTFKSLVCAFSGDAGLVQWPNAKLKYMDMFSHSYTMFLSHIQLSLVTLIYGVIVVGMLLNVTVP
jgi:hypothetical protein